MFFFQLKLSVYEERESIQQRFLFKIPIITFLYDFLMKDISQESDECLFPFTDKNIITF